MQGVLLWFKLRVSRKSYVGYHHVMYRTRPINTAVRPPWQALFPKRFQKDHLFAGYFD